MRTILLAMTAVIAVSPATTAQTIATYDPVTARITEVQPWSMMLPVPGTVTNVYPPTALSAPAPGLMPPSGGATWDGVGGYMWICNGTWLAGQQSPAVPPKVAVPAPFPIAANVLAPLGGYVTGIAYDPLTGVLWLVGPPGLVVGISPFPGTPVAVPMFPLLFPTGPITGLEWDGVTGSLYAVDLGGVVYRFLPGGGPVGAPLMPAVVPPPPISGVCIDKSGQPNAAGLMPIYVAGGGMIVDAAMPAPTPFPAGSPLDVGLTYIGAPATNPPGFRVGCACPNYAPGPIQSVASPMTNGEFAFGITVSGMPPNQLVLFAFDFVFNPAWPLLNGTGCPVGFVLGSPTIVTAISFTTAPGGSATYPLPLTLPALFGPIYNQNFALCAADPAGFVATPMQSIWASGL